MEIPVMGDQDTKDVKPVADGTATSSDGNSTKGVDQAAQSGSAENKPAGGDGHIPKARLDEVISERNELREQLEERAQELAEQTLGELLKDKPELRDKYFKGEASEPTEDPKPKVSENPTDRQLKELVAWKQREEERAELALIADEVESNMAQHDVLKDASARKFAIAEISATLAQNPRASIAKVVKSVAEEISNFISNTEKSVFERKKQGGQFPANGPGGTSPIVEPEKLNFNDGSTKRALTELFAQKG